MFYTPSKKGLGETNRGARERLIQDFDKTSKDEIFNLVGQFL